MLKVITKKIIIPEQTVETYHVEWNGKVIHGVKDSFTNECPFCRLDNWHYCYWQPKHSWGCKFLGDKCYFTQFMKDKSCKE